MLNLLRFVAGGRERYREYESAVAPLLEKVGGGVIYQGVPGRPLLGDSGWDLVLLVRYPSRGAFLEMVSSEEYREIEHLRSEALSEGELHPMDSSPTSPG